MSDSKKEFKTAMIPFLVHQDQGSQSDHNEPYRIKGYASVFDEVDSHNDRVVRGAFTKSLSAGAKSGKKPKFLWHHQQDAVIGHWSVLREDDHGLYVEGHLIPGVQKADEAAALIQHKAIDGLSIGYRVTKAIKGKEASSFRLLTEVDLIEISLVTFPSNGQSLLH